MELSVKADFKSVQQMFKQFPTEVKAAAVSALNKTASATKTAMYKRIKQRRTLTLGAADIKALLKISPASPYRLTTSVSISGKMIPLNQYKLQRRKAGISVDVVGTGMKGPVEKYGNKAFSNPSLGAGTAIFVRSTSKRLPIEKLFGPSLPSALTAQGWTEDVLKVEMTGVWEKNFVNQLQWRLQRYASR